MIGKCIYSLTIPYNELSCSTFGYCKTFMFDKKILLNALRLLDDSFQKELSKNEIKQIMNFLMNDDFVSSFCSSDRFCFKMILNYETSNFLFERRKKKPLSISKFKIKMIQSKMKNLKRCVPKIQPLLF